MFLGQRSGASYVTASKLLDATLLLPGCGGEQLDAPSAYTKALLFEDMDAFTCLVTYIQLPANQGFPSWHKLYGETGQQLVCRLLNFFMVTQCQGSIVKRTILKPCWIPVSNESSHGSAYMFIRRFG